MGGFEPPHTPGLAGSALHHRALVPVEHKRDDKPTGTEYKGEFWELQESEEP
jgi:hypothetical protein